jgi:hypothetical protein
MARPLSAFHGWLSEARPLCNRRKQTRQADDGLDKSRGRAAWSEPSEGPSVPGQGTWTWVPSPRLSLPSSGATECSHTPQNGTRRCGRLSSGMVAAHN